jgi:ferredoxin
VITVDYEKCDECGTCIAVCKSNAIVLLERLEVLADMCTKCGVCVKICPVAALTE